MMNIKKPSLQSSFTKTHNRSGQGTSVRSNLRNVEKKIQYI